MKLCDLLLLIDYVSWDPVNGEAIKLTTENLNQTLGKLPEFEKAADLIHREYDFNGLVMMAKVNCDEEPEIAKYFRISKYPTIKMVVNGETAKREYRGQRQDIAIVEYVRAELKDPIKKFEKLDDLATLDKRKRHVIGYFDQQDSAEYRVFRRVAANLKDDCDFHVGFGEFVKQYHPDAKPAIVFRADADLSHDGDELFEGGLNSLEDLKAWPRDKCIPFVKEITFDNAEELTEEGLPFMIMFYDPKDVQSVKDYKEQVKKYLINDRKNILLLVADGQKFAHPLAHLGKSQEDLPLIAIDSFRHMYLFSSFSDIFIEGKLKQFVEDLYSGKLHREFHYGPDPTPEEKPAADHEPTQDAAHQEEHHDDAQHEEMHDADESTPPDSSFKKLAPSPNRYTLLPNDEL